jgi:AcrR family transcriptional regulator
VARTKNPVTHAVRRDAFVAAGARLIQTKGYEQTSVQDVLDELEASRGAFYHYFDSKGALLEAVAERMVDAAFADVEPAVDAPGLTALERLKTMFGGIASWKEARAGFVLELLRSWMDDDNALAREKVRQGLVPRLVPLLARIVRQGIAEGTFAEGDPEATARVLVSVIQGANEAATQLFIARQAGAVTFEEVERTLTGYQTAIERILGIQAGSFPIAEPDLLRRWFDRAGPLDAAPIEANASSATLDPTHVARNVAENGVTAPDALPHDETKATVVEEGVA